MSHFLLTLKYFEIIFSTLGEQMHTPIKRSTSRIRRQENTSIFPGSFKPVIADIMAKAVEKSSARKNTQAILTAINVMNQPMGFGRL